jgi:uncharacterized protein YjeT (DUF2065 family)
VAEAAVSDLLTAVALIFVIEGLVLALFPTAPLRLYAQLKDLPPDRLRGFGLGAIVFGLLVVWLLRG